MMGMLYLVPYGWEKKKKKEERDVRRGEVEKKIWRAPPSPVPLCSQTPRAHQVVHGQCPLRAQQLLGLAVGVGVFIHFEDEGREFLTEE